MKARELRIGNKLQKDNGEIFTVLRLDQTKDILVEEQRGLLTLDYNLFGIPLTEEWLLKLGAKYINYKENQDYYQIPTKLLPLNITPRLKNKVDFGFGFLRYCEYVHQLQNLYFTLTGEELTIKPDQL